ncbi:MAG: HigA family addiction module antidote protein [Bacteroidales bacterium]|nr:HigA family addiction module antidote protein [Bacteroidales bacterium]
METRNNYVVGLQATHPGELLEAELEERGIKQKDFAAQIGLTPANLSSFIHGRRNLSVSLAEKLEKVLNIDAKVWLNMQSNYNYDTKIIARREKKTAKGKDIALQPSYAEELLNVLNRLSDQIGVLIAQNQNNSRPTYVH